MIKPIKGSWFEFQHPFDVEGVYWNPACAQFTAEQWEQKIKEVADIGMEYLVLMSIALDGYAYFDTDIFPKSNLECDDPIEAVLSAADKYGVKFFVSNDFFGNWREPHKMVVDEEIEVLRVRAMEQIARKYSHHQSFYGWYWPNEACICGYYHDEFIKYVNRCSALAHLLTPEAKTLIAPYGTNMVLEDDKYLRQLDKMDVDIIAYQDEIGVRKTKVEQSPAIFEALRRLHDKVPQRKLWADVEIFEFEGGVYESALIPADFARVKKQFAAVSDFVDNILVYQFQGMMNVPESPAFAGHKESTKLYSDYVAWLQKEHADMLGVGVGV